jgi:hypothetical protein
MRLADMVAGLPAPGQRPLQVACGLPVAAEPQLDVSGRSTLATARPDQARCRHCLPASFRHRCWPSWPT